LAFRSIGRLTLMACVPQLQLAGEERCGSDNDAGAEYESDRCPGWYRHISRRSGFVDANLTPWAIVGHG